MPKDSLKKLLQKFPYFLDKSVGSNFYKSQSVTNEQFQDIYQSLFDVIESFHINKKVLIWKEQNEPYLYTIYFIARYPNLKSVKIFKNNNLIHTEEYLNTDEITTFYYFYEGDTQNNILDIIGEEYEEENEELSDGVEAEIIPLDTFYIEIETYNEIIIRKGFPENDKKQNDIYDHDYSLDEIGSLNNIPRKEYIVTDDYKHTEPPYNNRLTEDDYHYMNRIINYNILAQTVPLPVAEIWKLYGIEATMLNRERLLLKMFDVSKHETEKTEIVSGWIPQPWEHKDGFCTKTSDLGTFFFVSANNINPQKFKDVKFNFKLMNSLTEPLEEENFTVDIYLENELLEENYNKLQYTAKAILLDEMNVNTFKFIAKKLDGTIIGERTIEIQVRGCNDADFYVTSNGNDENDGSISSPFATITKAINEISTSRNIIVVSGEIELDKLNTISNSCTIIGCNNGKITSNLPHNRFFNISPKNNVILTDLTLEHNYASSYFYSEEYINENNELSNNETVLVHGGTPVLILTTNQEDYYHYYDNIKITGILKSKKETLLPNMDLDIFLEDTFIKSTTTDESGEFEEWIHIEDTDLINLNIKFSGSDVFFEENYLNQISLQKDTPIIPIRYGRLATLNSENYEPSQELGVYISEILEKSIVANEDGEISVTFLPEYGETFIFISEDGQQIYEEFIIDSRFYISDLDVDYLVTDVEIDDDGLVYLTKKPLSDFETLNSLQEVIIDLTLDDGNFCKDYFVAESTDKLDGNEIYPDDLEIIKNAILDVSISDTGDLECERINIIMEEEPDV